MLYRRIDILDTASPHPIVVVEVGISLPAFRTRTVTLDAIDLEGGGTAGKGKLP
ncbi:hypothetical protein D3C72_2584790 [compost metagenome]